MAHMANFKIEQFEGFASNSLKSVLISPQKLLNSQNGYFKTLTAITFDLNVASKPFSLDILLTDLQFQ